MDKPFEISEIVGTLKPIANLIPGWKTSEAQLTAAVGGLYALGQAAEGLGLIHSGATSGLWPMAAMVGLYVLSRTLLKARTPQPTALAAVDPPRLEQSVTPNALAEVVAQALEEAKQQALGDVQAKLLGALGGQVQSTSNPSNKET